MESLDKRKAQRKQMQTLAANGVKPESGDSSNIGGSAVASASAKSPNTVAPIAGEKLPDPGTGNSTDTSTGTVTDQSGQSGQGDQSGVNDEFTSMTVAELQQYATDNGSPVPSNITLKADIQTYVRNLKKYKEENNGAAPGAAGWNANQ